MRSDVAHLPPTIGRYSILRPLGQGAMGRVLLARDPVLGREVALKLLRDDLGLPPDLRDALLARMRNEAMAAARVSHPNLVTLHDMGEDDALGVFLVFEYVPGDTLRDRIAAGALAPGHAARIAREIGSALSEVHAAGVVHRDVKPENVMLSPHGSKITDFGIARIPDSTLTRAGGLFGTPAYSAPEALGAGSFSPASDQFSFAATMYEAISGERAFPGSDAVAVAARVATQPPAPFAARLALDPKLDAILLRAMSKEPEARFDSCVALGTAIADALEGPPRPRADATTTLVDPPPPPLGATRGKRIALGGLVLAAVASAVVVGALRGTPLVADPAAAASASSLRSAASVDRARSPSSASARPRPRPTPTPASTGATSSTRDAGEPPGSGSAPALPQLPSPDAE